MRGAMKLDVFYPIVPNVAWFERLAAIGVTTMQLRLKDADAETVEREVADAVRIARKTGVQLIVNDYWEAAIRLGANALHLGQEDLAAADLAAIRKAGLAFGISTHSEEELDIALRAKPDYIALGPIFETKLKAMAWAPQGLDRIGVWKAKIGAIPLVAIGGITPERAAPVRAAGADSIAVITDFMTAPHPEARVRLWLDWAASVRGA